MGRKTVLGFMFLFLFSLAFFTFPNAFADRGGWSPLGYNVFEGGQKAIAAWNGTDEVLVLSTDVRGSQETQVIEIMPLPSVPEIEKGSEDSFRQVRSLVRQFEFYYYIAPSAYLGRSYGAAEKEVEIIFHDEIGAHFITVVKANVTEELILWIEGFLSGMGIDYAGFPSGLDDLVDQYMEDKLYFYVLDVITVDSSVKSVEPLVYRFKSSSLYYPLRISSLFSGDTEIWLCTLTSGELDDTAMLRDGFKKVVRFRVKLEAVSEVDSEMSVLFHGSPYLCIYEFNGSLENLERDVQMGFVPFLNFAPFFRVHPFLAITAFLLGALFVLFFVVTTKGKNRREIGMVTGTYSLIIFLIVLGFDFLVIWTLNSSVDVHLDLLADVYVWRNFFMFESIAMMLLGGVSHWKTNPPNPKFAIRETQVQFKDHSRNIRFWLSLATAGIAIFILFVYLSGY